MKMIIEFNGDSLVKDGQGFDLGARPKSLLPGLVNIQKTNWKFTIFLMGKLTISMAMFTSLLYVYQRVQICMTCKYILMVIAVFSGVMTGAFPEEVEGPTFQIHALTYVPAGQVRWMSSMM
jgi:hypothetical protein